MFDEDDLHPNYVNNHGEVITLLVSHNCSYCKNDMGYITNGKGPHIAAIECRKCFKHQKWISAAELSKHLIARKMKEAFPI